MNGTPYSPMGWIYYLSEFNGFAPWDPKRLLTHFPGNFGCYRRETFTKYGLYPSGNFGPEDLVKNWEIIRKGGRLFFDPDIRAAHINPTKFRAYLRTMRRLGFDSSIARRRTGDLPGQFFIKYPVFAFILPFARFGLLFSRLIRRNRIALLTLLLLSPVYLIGLYTWVWGFLKGAIADEKDVWGTDCGRK